ncbi:MAG: FKBP-type peptidyl-prolyl cis-trans isomerase [Bacteroidota bacterium]
MRHLLFALVLAFLASCGSDSNSLSPEEYINLNNLQATELSEGVFIIIHDEGNEERASLEQVVDVNYTARLTDETQFDQAEDFTVSLGSLIPGWQIGLGEIGVGGSCTLIIPYQVGFGEVQNGPVPAKSTLIFEITLNDIYSIRTVEEYITDNELNTTVLDKGVQIVIHEPGSDVKPNPDSQVVINYIGKLTNELVFDRGVGVTFGLGNLIEGWQIGLQELGESGSCTLVIPSDAAYGDAQVGIIPPNSPLVFEIDLISVD